MAKDEKSGEKRPRRERNRDKVKPPTKIVIRHLPPTMTEEEFLKQVDPLPEHDFYYYAAADWSLGFDATCRAYITLKRYDDVFLFRDRFDGYVFVDQKGNEYAAIVEFAPFQGFLKNKSRGGDNKVNTVELEPHYKQFLAKLEEEREAKGGELKLEFSLDSKKEEITSTPLLQYIANKKEMRREESRKRTAEKKRRREEENEKRNSQKQIELLKPVKEQDEHGKNDRKGNNRGDKEVRDEKRLDQNKDNSGKPALNGRKTRRQERNRRRHEAFLEKKGKRRDEKKRGNSEDEYKDKDELDVPANDETKKGVPQKDQKREKQRRRSEIVLQSDELVADDETAKENISKEKYRSKSDVEYQADEMTNEDEIKILKASTQPLAVQLTDSVREFIFNAATMLTKPSLMEESVNENASPSSPINEEANNLTTDLSVKPQTEQTTENVKEQLLQLFLQSSSTTNSPKNEDMAKTQEQLSKLKLTTENFDEKSEEGQLASKTECLESVKEQLYTLFLQSSASSSADNDYAQTIEDKATTLPSPMELETTKRLSSAELARKRQEEKEQRLEERRIRNKDRPSIAIYQPKARLRLSEESDSTSASKDPRSQPNSDCEATRKDEPTRHKKIPRYSERSKNRKKSISKESTIELDELKTLTTKLVECKVEDTKSTAETEIVDCKTDEVNNADESEAIQTEPVKNEE